MRAAGEVREKRRFKHSSQTDFTIGKMIHIDAAGRTMVHAERVCDCPFSVAQDYAVTYLQQVQKDGPEAIVTTPLLAIRRRVHLLFGIDVDIADPGRQHEEIRLHWTSGSRWCPDFSGTVRFRIMATSTRVIVDGSYAAPLGRLGAIFDRLIGRFIAAATIDEFASRIALELEQRQHAWLASLSVLA